MKSAALLLIAFVGLAIVWSAYDNQTKAADMAECQMKAMQLYPHQAGDDTALGEAGDYTYLCMRSKGYGNGDAQTCPSGRGWVGEIDERCYRKPWVWENL